MAANPFLFTEDEYTSPHSNASNPFLMNDNFQVEAECADNPFLAQAAGNSTNPFAFDPEELEATESSYVPYTFESVVTTQAFVTANTTVPTQNFTDTFRQPTNDGILPQKPTDLDLKYTNTVANAQDGTKEGGRGPPPPRPPPSKETQDLLMSVMGAMDATSSHLLDRIPPTRTPSPVSMRDLHSPSPTPEPTFGDLLDVSDAKTQNEQKPAESSDLLMLGENDEKSSQDVLGSVVDKVCDINQNPSSASPVRPLSATASPRVSPRASPRASPAGSRRASQEQVKPTRPAPPVRPPRPVPPQKPPPPSMINQVNAPLHAHPPPKPPPPTAAPAQTTTQTSNAPEMMDMFLSDGVPPQKTKASTADILNLYNAPATKPEAVTDLLFDSVEPAVTEPAENVPTEKVSVVEDAPIDVSSQALGDNSTIENVNAFTSPEQPHQSQNDLGMVSSISSESNNVTPGATFNPFAANEEPIQKAPIIEDVFTQNSMIPGAVDDVFLQNTTNTALNQKAFQESNAFSKNNISAFGEQNYSKVPTNDNFTNINDAFGDSNKNADAFDDFAEKFESAAKDDLKPKAFDAFSNGATEDAWGQEATGGFNDPAGGFGAEESFDAFLAMREPPAVPQSTPSKFNKVGSEDSDEDKDFSVFIKPSTKEEFASATVPVLAPPPVTPVQAAFTDSSPRFNPFDQQNEPASVAVFGQEPSLPLGDVEMKRTDSQETPPTPLFDDDVSQPLEPFPRVTIEKDGWEMHLRQPNKKKITGQRFWKKIFVRIVTQNDCVLLQLFNQQADKDPFQELPLQPCYSVSDIGTQQYDQFGKIFTVKLQYIFYKERPGVRPGQVKKAERITNKLSQFAAYAMQGDYQGVKEFGSDLKKLGLPVEHAPQVSQLMKLGSLNYEDLKQFSVAIEEALFILSAHRDRALHYKMEEVQITVVDELYVEQSAEGHVEKQIARVRLFFLGFLTGMPDVELGINDMRRQGKEVVGRHDIIPVVTEEWIRLEAVEFHSCVQQDEYNDTHIIKFKPPDACYIELLRFRIRPPKNRELPLQLKPTICITGNKIELRADVLVPGFASRKLGQVPCEDVMIKFPIPECWIYMFRVEKHFRYGSVKSAHRRTGKIKGIERILGTMDALQESLIEVTSGQAKYEHQHRAIVWRCPRLPKEGQGAYTTHNMVCRLALTSFDQMPEQLAEYCYVEFTMPATQASHTTVRSVSLQNSDSDEPPEKYVRYLARHEYRVGIEHTQGEGPNAYVVATIAKTAPVPEEPTPPAAPDSSSDSD